MKGWVVGVAAGLLAACASTPDAIERHVAFLTSDECAGRLVGTNGEYTAAAYIANEFGRGGRAVERQEFSVPGRDGARGFNIVQPRAPGIQTTANAGPIVVGAHYDHLGRGYPGADDNASGTAAIIELSRDCTWAGWVVAFSGEEQGVLGSAAFVREHSQVSAMINLDMVGRMRDRTVIVSGTGTGHNWEDLLARANTTGLRLVFDESGLGNSDHSVFAARGIPAVHIFTGNHEDHHEPTDTPDKLNYAGIREIVGFVSRLVREIERDPPIFRHVTSGASMSGFRVRFGTMPDYGYEGPGVRLQGVGDGGPASRAGLRPDDIIVQVEDIEIDDVQTYTDLLNELNPGEPVEVVYERNGSRATTTLIPEAP